MVISENDAYIIAIMLNKYLNHANILKMRNIKHHRTTNTYNHVINVAAMSYLIVKRFNIQININDLLAGAILHDYYLYDWREKQVGIQGIKHGFYHPKIAKDNAVRDFKISERVQDIIRQHMFPYTPHTVPKSKEAWIVQIADKICAVYEIFGLLNIRVSSDNNKKLSSIHNYIEICNKEVLESGNNMFNGQIVYL